jgi:hypothetical protein
MKTKTFHKSANMGVFGESLPSDMMGYVTYHDSPRYSKMNEDELRDMASNHRFNIVRTAAKVELAERAVQNWQEGKN